MNQLGQSRLVRQGASVLCAIVGSLAVARAAEAHQGPPYPVLVDRPVGPYVVSVWADPDIGTASFFIGMDRPRSGPTGAPNVDLAVWPSDGRLPPAHAAIKAQRDESRLAQVVLDRGELWNVRLTLSGPRGDGQVDFAVMATPPGYGRWDLLIYAGPFLLLAFLAVAIAIKRRRLLAAAP